MTGVLKRVTILTNTPSPYRLPFLQILSHKCDLLVVFEQEREPNRQWAVPDDLGFKHTYAAGITIPYLRKRPDGLPADQRYFQFRYGVFLKLLRSKPALVISAECGFRSLQAALYCWMTKTPLILWSEGTPHTDGWMGGLKRRIRRFLVARSSRFWVCGIESAELIRQDGGVDGNIDKGINGVDTRWFSEEVRRRTADRDSLRPKYGISGTCFLFVGQFIPRKGLPQFLAALDQLSKGSCDFTVLLVGDGDHRPLVEDWMRSHKNVNVQLLGYRQQSEMPEIYAAADVFVLPTLDDNWSIVPLEAAVSGLPQLFSKYNGSSADLLFCGAQGILYDPFNTNQFAEILAEYCRNLPPRVEPGVVHNLVEYYSPEAFAERAWQSIQAALR
jgi:glycosyltransferase involved in cell wall biosynthesis